jgi:hypothetical protein
VSKKVRKKAKKSVKKKAYKMTNPLDELSEGDERPWKGEDLDFARLKAESDRELDRVTKGVHEALGVPYEHGIPKTTLEDLAEKFEYDIESMDIKDLVIIRVKEMAHADKISKEVFGNFFELIKKKNPNAIGIIVDNKTEVFTMNKADASDEIMQKVTKKTPYELAGGFEDDGE